MARQQTRGTCCFCERALTKAGLARHLGACRQKKPGDAVSGPRKSFYHIAVQGRYLPDYWMHLEVRADATLLDLDAFLRDTWLECCGHLSAFTIDDAQHMPMADEWLDSESMDFALEEVLEPGMTFRHEYDFGTTTELSLKVIAEWQGKPRRDPVRILARNDAPVIDCDYCGKPATQLCTECMYEGRGALCEDCAGDHECGEEMLLPVVNSPRVGMCGYTG